MIHEARTYWVDDPTLHECIEKGRRLREEMTKRGVPCDIGVIDDGYGTYWYQIELDGFDHENYEAARQFSYEQLHDILVECKIEIVPTACRLELG